MRYLKGFKDYLDENYQSSIFESAQRLNNTWVLHLHGHQIHLAKVTDNLTYEVELTDENDASQIIPKTQIKLLYPFESQKLVQKKIKSEPKVKKLKLQAIISARPRHHIKNKSLYVLMKERQVVFFTLLEGEVIRGIIANFTRYDITVNLKGGVPVTLLRHSVYDLRDKKERCYLKKIQETQRDWKKSTLYTPMEN